LLTIIIVTWNCREEIAECLQSLSVLENLPTEIETIVVDNCSKDGTADFLRNNETSFGSIQLKAIFNSENLGLSRATEQAYRKARGNWILLCNPDISFNERVKEFLEYGIRVPDSIVTAEMVNSDGRIQRAVFRRFPTITQVFFDFGYIGSYLDKKIMRHVVRKRFTYEGEDLPRVASIDSPGASFLLLSRRTIERLGVIFDPSFPVWWNDVDLAKRADIERVPRLLLTWVKLKHGLSRGGSGQMEDITRRYLFCRSMVRYARRWKMHPRLIRFLFFIDALAGLPISVMVLRQGLGCRRAAKNSMRRATMQVSGVMGA